jgi:hypothetical protein
VKFVNSIAMQEPVHMRVDVLSRTLHGNIVSDLGVARTKRTICGLPAKLASLDIGAAEGCVVNLGVA